MFRTYPKYHYFQIKFGVKSKNQLPLFMIWKEEVLHGEVVMGWVLFNSMDYIKF